MLLCYNMLLMALSPDRAIYVVASLHGSYNDAQGCECEFCHHY